MLFPTTLVGSYPQPEWLIDRAKLAGRFPPRVRARELWRVPEQWLAQAQDDATVIAIRAQEQAGLDIVTDGEIRRESYSNRFATALEGVDIDNPGTALDRSGHPNPVPRVVGPIRRKHAVQVDDLLFLKRHTTRLVKVTVPGPFTMAQQAQVEYYDGSRELAALDYAAAVNEEIRDLFAARRGHRADRRALHAGAAGRGARLWPEGAQSRARRRDRHGRRAHLLRLRGDHSSAAVGLLVPAGAGAAAVARRSRSKPRSRISIVRCSASSTGKKILLGVLDLSDMNAETPEQVAARIRRALPYVDAKNIIVAPDCGMKYLPREVADAKLRAMVEGARIVRNELA